MRISDWSSDVCSSDLCVTLQGFLIFEHYEARHAAFVEQMSAWLRDGQIAVVEDVIDGLEHATAGLIGLLRGDNFGKLVVRVGECCRCSGISTGRMMARSYEIQIGERRVGKECGMTW